MHWTHINPNTVWFCLWHEGIPHRSLRIPHRVRYHIHCPPFPLQQTTPKVVTLERKVAGTGGRRESKGTPVDYAYPCFPVPTLGIRKLSLRSKSFVCILAKMH